MNNVVLLYVFFFILHFYYDYCCVFFIRWCNIVPTWLKKQTMTVYLSFLHVQHVLSTILGYSIHFMVAVSWLLYPSLILHNIVFFRDIKEKWFLKKNKKNVSFPVKLSVFFSIVNKHDFIDIFKLNLSVW